VSSDDPEYAATLAGVLDDVGRPREAEHWRDIAASRYDELVSRHPEAFADHAADFQGSVAARAESASRDLIPASGGVCLPVSRSA
jgi:hypothetical protein